MDRPFLADQAVSSAAPIRAPRVGVSIVAHPARPSPASSAFRARGASRSAPPGQRSIPESNSLLDAPALLRGAELLEQEFEASLPSIRRLVVVVHMPIVPGARTPRSSKRDNSKDSRGPTSSRGAA